MHGITRLCIRMDIQGRQLMFKNIWQWITRNTFNGRFHDHYADMSKEALDQLVADNIARTDHLEQLSREYEEEQREADLAKSEIDWSKEYPNNFNYDEGECSD
jgi:hypothetical protein